MIENKENIPEEIIDKLWEYFKEKHTESDDVEKEEYRFQEWVDGLDLETINEIINI